MNKWGEEGGPAVSLGRWENRKAADHSRQHWDQQVGEKAEKTWILNRRTRISRRVSLGYSMQTGSSKREQGDTQTWTERRMGTYGKKQTSRLGIRSPGF